MTETSPVGAVGHAPAGVDPGSTEEMDWRAKTGRAVPGVEVRIVGEDGDELPWDGESIGEIEVRRPWVTASYWGDPAPAKFHDGWLRTGDVGTITSNACVVADGDVPPEEPQQFLSGRLAAGARELGVRRRDSQDLGRQVRQEGVAHAV